MPRKLKKFTIGGKAPKSQDNVQILNEKECMECDNPELANLSTIINDLKAIDASKDLSKLPSIISALEGFESHERNENGKVTKLVVKGV